MSNKTNNKATVEVNNANTADTVVDAVFVIGTGSQNNNEELKYALRNLEGHCPFVRDVYICGECPDWVDKSAVKYLKWPDRFSHAKDANIIDKLRHACEQPGIAKNILFCSDDQFQTRVCTWEDFAPRWLRKYTPTDGWYESRNRLWHTRLHKTLDRDRRRRREQGLDVTTVYYYQPHIWMPMDRDKFIEYAKWSDYEHRDDTIIASGYFNYIDAGGEFNYGHIFISPGQKWPVEETHVAYSDTSFDAAMKYLKSKFSNLSRFEIGYKKPQEVEKKEVEKKQPASVQPVDSVVDKEKLLYLIQTEPAWASLKYEALIAEGMRINGVSGWEKVWNSIIERWSDATDSGKLRLPVTVQADEDVRKLISDFEKNYPASKKAAEDAGTVKITEQPMETNEPEKKAVKHECKVCKSKNIWPKIPENVTDVEYAIGNPDGTVVPIKPENVIGTEQTIHLDQQQPSDYNEVQQSVYTEGCIDCAVDHISTAIAYLNSEAGRPTYMDVTLASGEARVAATHLRLLGRTAEYDALISALDSYRLESSTFTAQTLSFILGQLLNEG